MIEVVSCQLKAKLDKGSSIDKEESKKIAHIVRKQMNFMIRNSIPMTPKYYENWFYIFCHITEKHLDPTDLELIGLYKEAYDGNFDELIDQNIKSKALPKESANNSSKKLAKIADEIDSSLLKIIDSIYQHNDSIDNHSDAFREHSKTLNTDDINSSLKQIIEELQSLKQENQKMSAKLNDYHENIRALNQELAIAKTEAEIDFLTGIVNRRRFERATETMLEDLKTKHYPFSIIMLDIDHFKHINDKYGHPVGDSALKELAEILKTFLRANAIPGRVGGEEFAVILPGSPIQDANHIAERLRQAVENRTFPNDIKVTASFGVTEAKKTDDVVSLFSRVDEALYKAKKSGRNVVISA